MNKKIKYLLAFTICLIALIPLIPTSNVYALTAASGAEIFSSETNSEFGNILYFPNSESSVLTRESTILARKFAWFDTSEFWTTIIPQEQPGAQNIESGSFVISLKYNDVNSTIENFKDHGVAFHFYTTIDGTNFTDVTSSLVSKGDGKYQVVGEFIGYKIELGKIDPDATITDSFEVTTNCNIKIDSSALTSDQLTGQTGLLNWLDSKFGNAKPTSNNQSIFVIQPTISGKIKHQTLSDENDTPDWESAAPIKDVPVDLLEKTPTGDKVVASTLTDSDGNFTFSNVNGEKFKVSDTKNPLSVKVNQEKYKEWVIKDDTPPSADNTVVNVGRLTDIARQSGNYSLAESKTNWYEPFDEVLEDGKNATNNQFVLTDYPVDPDPDPTPDPDPKPTPKPTPKPDLKPMPDCKPTIESDLTVMPNPKPVSEPKKKTMKNLPSTGDSNSSGSVLVGVLLVIATFFLRHRKKTN